MELFIFVMGCITAIALSIIILRRYEKPPMQKNNNRRGIDSLHMDGFSSEEQAIIQEVAAFCGVRYVTQEDLRKHTIAQISRDFSQMSGWNMWDTSIHEAPGQYDRMGRAALDKKIQVLFYDPRYKIAKIKGVSGVYLTSHQRCSCPDYRERRIPCKHMYLLAMELDGDIGKHITSQEYGRLCGLSFALAGRFSRGQNGKSVIRAKIENQGGRCLSDITKDCTALVTGTSPSAVKMERAIQADMEILTEEMIDNLFSNDIKSV